MARTKEEVIKQLEEKYLCECKIIDGEYHFICGDITVLVFTNKNRLGCWCFNTGNSGAYSQISFPTLKPIYELMEILENENN